MENLEDCTRLQFSVESVQQWFVNKLLLNSTNSSIMSRRGMLSSVLHYYCIDYSILLRVNSICYLGILLNSWIKNYFRYIERIVSEGTQTMGFMNMKCKSFNIIEKRKMYFVFEVNWSMDN